MQLLKSYYKPREAIVINYDQTSKSRLSPVLLLLVRRYVVSLNQDSVDAPAILADYVNL